MAAATIQAEGRVPASVDASAYTPGARAGPRGAMLDNAQPARPAGDGAYRHSRSATRSSATSPQCCAATGPRSCCFT